MSSIMISVQWDLHALILPDTMYVRAAVIVRAWMLRERMRGIMMHARQDSLSLRVSPTMYIGVVGARTTLHCLCVLGMPNFIAGVIWNSGAVS